MPLTWTVLDIAATSRRRRWAVAADHAACAGLALMKAGRAIAKALDPKR